MIILTFQEVLTTCIIVFFLIVPIFVIFAAAINSKSLWAVADQINESVTYAVNQDDYSTASTHQYAWYMFVNSRLNDKHKIRNVTPERFFGDTV